MDVRVHVSCCMLSSLRDALVYMDGKRASAGDERHVSRLRSLERLTATSSKPANTAPANSTQARASGSAVAINSKEDEAKRKAEQDMRMVRDKIEAVKAEQQEVGHATGETLTRHHVCAVLCCHLCMSCLLHVVLCRAVLSCVLFVLPLL